MIPCGSGVFCCGNDPNCSCNTGQEAVTPITGTALAIIGVTQVGNQTPFTSIIVLTQTLSVTPTVSPSPPNTPDPAPVPTNKVSDAGSVTSSINSGNTPTAIPTAVPYFSERHCAATPNIIADNTFVVLTDCSSHSWLRYDKSSNRAAVAVLGLLLIAGFLYWLLILRRRNDKGSNSSSDPPINRKSHHPITNPELPDSYPPNNRVYGLDHQDNPYESGHRLNEDPSSTRSRFSPPPMQEYAGQQNTGTPPRIINANLNPNTSRTPPIRTPPPRADMPPPPQPLIPSMRDVPLRSTGQGGRSFGAPNSSNYERPPYDSIRGYH
ncbi:MAG: hypothetical protein MMC33_008328 [Icmadophila ericetorum]|nr:hypothetical protein [Icmadophila ericetorum]